jgi:hypothetical protein
MKVEASSVSATTKRDASVLESCVQRKFTPAPLWTEAMLAALQRGVKGGKWHSLIDKVWHPDTLMLAWTQVERNAGAAGVDRVSVERFAQARDYYLAELASALRDLWHDRAVFHFLTAPEERVAYIRAVLNSVKPGGHVIVATFADDGPTQCSGLPVMRYSADALHSEFGERFTLLRHDKEAHYTPFGTIQQFVYCYCRKLGA